MKQHIKKLFQLVAKETFLISFSTKITKNKFKLKLKLFTENIQNKL